MVIKQTVSIIIPARFGSKRLPGKPLIVIAGRPLILHVLDRAREIPEIDRIIVATDDERVLKVVQDAGEQALMTPEDLPSGSDRVGWVSRKLTDDIVVNLQGDEPLIDARAVNNAIIELKADPTLMVTTLGYPLTRPKNLNDPNVVKVITDEERNALYFSRQPIPYFRDGTFFPVPGLYQHLGVYIYRREFLLQFVEWEMSPLEKAEKLEQLRILSKGYRIKVVETEYPSFGVDTPQDVIRLEEMLKKQGLKSE